MILRRIRIASQLALAVLLGLPFAAIANGPGAPAVSGLLALPTMGPFGIASLAAGAAGVALLISRGRRKKDDD